MGMRVIRNKKIDNMLKNAIEIKIIKI